MGGFRGGSVVKNPPAKAGDTRDVGLIPELGRSPGEGNGNLLQYSCLENSMHRGAWRATVHGVAKSQPRLSNQTTASVLASLTGSGIQRANMGSEWRGVRAVGCEAEI